MPNHYLCFFFCSIRISMKTIDQVYIVSHLNGFNLSSLINHNSISSKMSSFFKLRCFQQQTTNKIIIGSSVIVAILGVVHWGYCIVLSRFLTLYQKYVYSFGGDSALMQQYRKLFDPPMAYCSITGIQQIIISVLVILIILEKIDTTTKRYIWVRVLTILLVSNYAFNFSVAVNSSMSATFYNEFFKDYIQNWHPTGNGFIDDYMQLMIIMVKYVTVEAVLTFVVSLPLITLTIIAFVQKTFLSEYELKSQNPNEVTTNKIKVVQIKS